MAVPFSPGFPDPIAGEGAPQKIDHAVIGGVVAVVMFAILCALIVLGRYFARHKGKTPEVQSHSIMKWSVVLLRVECSGTEVRGGIKGRHAANLSLLHCSPLQALTSRTKPKVRTMLPTPTRPSSTPRADTTTQTRRKSIISKAAGLGETGGDPEGGGAGGELFQTPDWSQEGLRAGLIQEDGEK